MALAPAERPTLSHEDFWRRYDAVEARLSAPLSERLLDLAGLRPGQSVLDLASGRGEPALRAARRVGPGGSVLGVDRAEGLLATARDLAAREGLAQVTFRTVEAEALDDLPAASFHAVTARWALMYFADPVRALAHARRALRDDGCLVAAVWAEPEKVPYVHLPRSLLARRRPLPAVDPAAPGTFRYASEESLARDLSAAGFAVASVEEIDVPVIESEDPADLVAWSLSLGFAKLLAGLAPEHQFAWERELTEALERSRVDGLCRLGGVTRLVRAVPQR